MGEGGGGGRGRVRGGEFEDCEVGVVDVHFCWVEVQVVPGRLEGGLFWVGCCM